MKPIISFDLWKTLIFSDAKFKDHRSAELMKFSPHRDQKVLDRLTNLLKEKEVYFDKYQVDNFGLQPDTSLIEDEVLNTLNSFGIDITFRQFLSIQYKCLEMYPPTYHPHLSYWLSALQKKYTLLLVSNTMFIPGLHLYMIVPILCHFDCLKFSDEIGWGKPSINILQDLDVSYRKQIQCHIGDTIETDGVFADNLGVEFLHVTTPESIIPIFENLLNCNK